MTGAADQTPVIEVMWRPGCPFCSSLRRGLRRAGVQTTEHDIWSSPEAAARVRAAAGGNETVPTVFVGAQSLVNPTARQVIAAARAVDPDYQPQSPGPASGQAASIARTALRPGPVLTLLIASAWAALAIWQPSTTWHLAPLILAAAWPWTVDPTAAGPAPDRSQIVAAGTAGLVVALALAAALAASDHLTGPTWIGSGTPAAEAAALSFVGAAAATGMRLLQLRRRITMRAPSAHQR